MDDGKDIEFDAGKAKANKKLQIIQRHQQGN